MRPIAIFRHFLSIASSSLLCISCAHAADVTWDITPGTVGIGNGSVTGGSGAWNTSTGNWTTNGGVNNLAWVNANNDTAIFSDTPGTITLGTGITVGGLIFNTPDYNVAGSTLTFGTAGIITANENATISSALAGSAITKTGTGTLVLSGNNSYTGTMTVSAGALSIGDGITNGTLNGSYLINSPGTLRIRYNTSGVQASWTGTTWNHFTGNGTLALATGKSGDGWGSAALTSDFTGTLQIGNGGAAGALGAGAVTNNGTLVFNRSGTVNVGQFITGSGAVTQEGSGNVTLAGANNYLGATTISAGTLTLGRNGALPTGSAVSIRGATLHAGTSINSAGTLGVTLGVMGPARIVFGSGATLVFSNSSMLNWTGFLQLGGNFISGASLRVGTTSGGLTAAQLQSLHLPWHLRHGLRGPDLLHPSL